MAGNEQTEIGDLDRALGNLQDMEPRGHSHAKNRGHINKQRVRVGSDHVGGSGDILDKRVEWVCQRCGEVVDSVDLRNG